MAAVTGLIYVSLVADPPDIAGLREDFTARGTPQGFERAKVAHVIDYDVDANWKLVWENNRECLHCMPCHPQYVKANFDVVDEQAASPAMRRKIDAAIACIAAKWTLPGATASHPEDGLATVPDRLTGRQGLRILRVAQPHCAHSRKAQ